MAKTSRDAAREARIHDNIVVDCYDEDERAMGWYYYLDEQLQCPFTAICIAKRVTSPLRLKDKVEVIGLPSEDDCAHEMLVMIRWEKAGLAVPLAQLKPIAKTPEPAKQAVADWHYWVERGYEF